MNVIIETIMHQINWKALYCNGFEFIQMSNEALRVHKGKKNLDITYNPGTDLYDLSEHTIQPDLTVKTRKIEGVFCDQLQDIIAEFFNIGEVRA